MLQRENVFTQYCTNCERAVRAVATTAPPHYTVIRTLLELLTQAVRHHSYDASIECRFVTLLEVLLSYDNPRWEPTDAVITIWKRLLQRIPSNVAPSRFRRMAYRVLVSLSWVPTSKGLLAACSFDDDTMPYPTFEKAQIWAHISKISTPPPLHHHHHHPSDDPTTTTTMKNRDCVMPLPRHDSVNQLLDRLKDETDVCVAITSGREGKGKTTLAALVASHPSIVRVFTVLWLDISHKKLTFDSYILHLKDVCHQLEISEPPEWPMSLQRFEEPAIRQLRELESMKIAKTILTELLEPYGKNLLLVLDDVMDAPTIQWFRFTSQQSIIVTTESRTNLDGVDWTLDLLPMCPQESMDLFCHEAALPPDHILGRTLELRTIVELCQCHPLTIRTVARWFLLKQVTAGPIQALEEILVEIQALEETRAIHLSEDDHSEDGPYELIFDVLSMMMGPVRKKETDTQSVLFVLCFAAMVVVFPDVAPLDSVILLWEQILKEEVLATDEIGGALSWEELSRYIWLIAEGLTHMGVISIVDSDGYYKVQVHHHIYQEFGLLIAREMEVKETFHHTTVDWHKFFVTGYMSKKSRGLIEKNDGTWKYIVEKLPSHMLHAHMLTTANVILSQEEFFQARIEALGWTRGIEIQIKDCVQVQHRIENGDETEVQASHVFNKTSILIREANADLFLDATDAERREKVAKALYLLGFALTENGYFRDALVYLEMAGSISIESQTLQTKIMYATCWCLLSENKTTQAKRRIEDIPMSTSQDKVWLNKEILQLKAAVLLGACSYRAAKNLLQDFLYALEDDEIDNCIELATTHEKLGRLYFLMGENDLAKNALTCCISRRNEIGVVSSSLSSTLSVLGDVNMALGLFNDARDNYKSAVGALNSLRCNEQHLDYRFVTGKLQFIDEDFSGCSASFELVRRTSNVTPLKVYDQSAYDLRYIAQVYYEIGDVEKSISILLESLSLTQSRPLSLERAKGMVAIGKCYLRNGMDNKALSHFQQAREIQMSKLGIYGDAIDTANLIGELQLKLGSYNEALNVLKKNYDDLLKSMPEDTGRVCGTLYLLADAYEVIGNSPEAIRCFNKYISVPNKQYGQCHLDRSKVLQRLGNLSMSSKAYDEAMIFLKEALAIRRDHSDWMNVMETLTSLGVLSRLQENYDPAMSYLLEASSLAKDNDFRDRANIMSELGNVYRLLSKVDQAEEIYRECVDMMEKENKLYGHVQMALGHVKFAQGDYVSALCNYEVVFEHLSQTIGLEDEKILQAIRSVGLAKFFAGNMVDAIDRFQQCLLHHTKISNGPSIDTVLMQLLTGDLSYQQQDFATATSSWNKAKNILAGIDSGVVDSKRWICSMVETRIKDDKIESMACNKFEAEIKAHYLVDDLH